MSNGWIKIHRQITDWEWYDEPNTFRVFFHLLLKANHKPKKYRGKTIEVGQIMTGLNLLSVETGLSIRSVRTCLSRLKSTNEITIKSNSKGTIIQIVKYKDYQLTTSERQTNDKPTTNERQTNDKPTTTNKNVNNEKNVKNVKNEKEVKILKIPFNDILNIDKSTLFVEWLEYREEIKKPIKNSKTLNKLIEQFDNTDLQELKRAVNKSIENNYTGLFINENNFNNNTKNKKDDRLKEFGKTVRDNFPEM